MMRKIILYLAAAFAAIKPRPLRARLPAGKAGELRALVRGATLFFYIFFVSCPCLFAEEMLIKCKDGVVVRGEVVSMQNGIYKIKSRTLGELSVRGEDIISMTNTEESPYATPNQEAVKKKILGNPQIMSSIQDLIKDQNVLDMFTDPELKAAIMRQDVEYLKQNEKFIRFMNKTSVQDIIQSVAAPSQDSSQE